MRGRFSLFIGLLLIPTAALAMPQALVYAGAWLLSYGTALSAAGWAVGIGLVVGGSVWGQSMQRKALQEQEAAARAAYNASLKDRTATVISSEHPHVYVYGQGVVVGVRVVDVLTSGDRDQYHHLVCVVVDHECDGILDVAINDKWLGTLVSGDVDETKNGNVTEGEYLYSYPVDVTEYHTGTTFNLSHTPKADSLIITDPIVSIPYDLVGTTVTVAESNSYTCSYQYIATTPRVRVIKRLGVPGTPADAVTLAEISASADPAQYTSTCTMDGKTGLIIRLDLDHAEFQGGVPSVKVKLNGKKVHDVRDLAWPNDVPVCSSNNALCIADYLTSEMCRVPVADLPQADYIAAANACDGLINIGGEMLPRYTLNGTVRSDQDRDQVLESMALSMAGSICSTTWSIHAGVWEAPVMALTQEDIWGDFNFNPGVADADLYNGIKGQFISADNLWVATDFKPYQNTTYVVADGGRELWNPIDFHFTDNLQRVHNLCRILTEDHRNAFSIEGYFSFKAWDLPQEGQRVTFTSPFLGQTTKIYRVMAKKVGLKQLVWLKLKEDAASIWDEADAVVPDSTPNTNLPNPFTIAPLTSLTCASGTDHLQRNGDGTITSRMYVTWPLPTTQGVVHGGYVEVEYRCAGTGAWSKVQVTGDDTDVYLAPLKDGLWYQIRARTVNPTVNLKSIWLYAKHQVIGKTTPPSDVTSLNATIVADGIDLSWADIPDLDRMDYAICQGAAWGGDYKFYSGNTTRLAPLPVGTYTYRIKARDTTKNFSVNDTSCTFSITAPQAPVFTGEFLFDSAKLSWTRPAAMQSVDHYELREGASWDTSTLIGKFAVTSHTLKANWVGSRTFWNAAVDVAGNKGTPKSLEMVISAPPAPTITAQVIDNNVLLYWNNVAGTLPIVEYELRKGSTWATAEPIGMKSGSFTSVFETVSGVYTYWLAAIDSARNYGTPGQNSTTVNQPPDYVLKSNFDSLFTGTKTNMAPHGDNDGSWITPVNTTETFGDHFASRGWATPQDQINAGYPVFIQPNLSPGSYEETVDYGTVLASNRITITLSAVNIVGTVAKACTISVSPDGTTWTDYVGTWEVYATQFRYVKVHITFTASNSTDLLEVTGINIRLDSKLKTMSKMVNCLASDVGGTVVYLTDDGTATGNKLFIDVEGVTPAAQGITPVNAMWDLSDVPNPLDVKLYLFNNAGARVSGNCSLTVRGF